MLQDRGSTTAASSYKEGALRDTESSICIIIPNFIHVGRRARLSLSSQVGRYSLQRTAKNTINPAAPAIAQVCPEDLGALPWGTSGTVEAGPLFPLSVPGSGSRSCKRNKPGKDQLTRNSSSPRHRPRPCRPTSPWPGTGTAAAASARASTRPRHCPTSSPRRPRRRCRSRPSP